MVVFLTVVRLIFGHDTKILNVGIYIMDLFELFNSILNDKFAILYIMSFVFIVGLLVGLYDEITWYLCYEWELGSRLRHWWLYRDKPWQYAYWMKRMPKKLRWSYQWRIQKFLLYLWRTKKFLWKWKHCKILRKKGVAWREAWYEADKAYKVECDVKKQKALRMTALLTFDRYSFYR